MAKDVKEKPRLDTTLAAINKKFGAGTIMKMGDIKNSLAVQVIPTQSLRLNRALGVGGLPRGRIIEIYGIEGSGKTSVVLGTIAEAQKAGLKAAFIDAECALDPEHAMALGVNLDELYYVQPDSAEQALDILEALVRTEEIAIVALDSVAALVPSVEMEGEMGDQQMGLQARLMSKALRKLTAPVSKSNTCCIFVNQIREKIGVYGKNPETTPGGRALRFYSSVRMEVRRGESITKNNDIIGHDVKISIKKNKVSPPHKKAEYRVIYTEGMDVLDEIADVAVLEGIVYQGGAWMSVRDDQGNVIEDPVYGPLKWNGGTKFKEFLTENPEFYKRIYDQVMAKIRSNAVIVPDAPLTEEEEAELNRIEQDSVDLTDIPELPEGSSQVS